MWTGLSLCRNCWARVPEHYMVGVVCYGCHLDGYIPEGYERSEAYRPDPLWGHANATRHPPLGVEFLDDRGGRRDGEALMPTRRPNRLGKGRRLRR